MRKPLLVVLFTLAAMLAGCVTINVYFPEAAAQKAADQFIGTVIDQDADKAAKPAPPAAKKNGGGPNPAAMLLDLLVPAAQAAETPDIRIQTAATEAIHGRMRQRFQDVLKPLLDSGAVGFTRDGLVAVHDAGKVPLASRAQAGAAVADENRDRSALYREVANANGHPEWEAQIRSTFAQGWIERAHAGWYYQDASGRWTQK
ncbi:YdbL family protein [Frateuria defendens]|uniref:YdbL family protein n=1 Tax=Frateuria defendens TaxID=2219559 RepID=UPI00066FD8AA|nr:YdbL family protein [Frateuria defendens]